MTTVSLKRREWRDWCISYGIGFFILIGVGFTFTAVLQAFYGWN